MNNVLEITKNLIILAALEEQEEQQREARQHKPLFPEWRTFSWNEDEDE